MEKVRGSKLRKVLAVPFIGKETKSDGVLSAPGYAKRILRVFTPRCRHWWSAQGRAAKDAIECHVIPCNFSMLIL